MLDPKLIRGDLNDLAAQLARRQFTLDIDQLSSLEATRKSSQTAMESLQAERNRVSKAIGAAKAKGDDTSEIMATVADLGMQLDAEKLRFEEASKALQSFYSGCRMFLIVRCQRVKTKPAMLRSDDGDNLESKIPKSKIT